MTLEQRVSRTEDRQDTMEELIRLVVQDIEGNRQILEEMRRENRQTGRMAYLDSDSAQAGIV